MLVIAIRKIETLMNKLVCLGLSILDLTKTALHEFWHDYLKRKYGKKAKLCFMDTESCIVYVAGMIFIKTLQKLLKQDFTPVIMSSTNHNRKENEKNYRCDKR